MSNDKSTTPIFRNHVIFLNICEFLDQKAKGCLAATCHFMKATAYESLYRNIFVHAELGQESSNFHAPMYDTSSYSHWSVLHNHLRHKDNSLRLFERSLHLNPNLVRLIRRVATDDAAFILMKLDKWAKFFREEHILRSLKFCNIRLTHFLHANKSLANFHQNRSVLRSIRELQVSNVDQLVHFITIAKLDGHCLNLESLSFYSGGLDSEYEVGANKDLIEVFDYLEELELESLLGSGIDFLIQLQQQFSRKKIFPRVKRLSLNHVHSNSAHHRVSAPNFSERLQFKIIKEIFEVESIKSWVLKVGCSVSSNNSNSAFGEFISQNLTLCNCLETFLLEFQLHKSNVEALHIQRRGPSLAKCPLNLYLFKKALSSFFKAYSNNFNNLKTLVLDTQCELAISEIHQHEYVVMRKPITILNDSIIGSIKRLSLYKLVICDYFEAFTIWDDVRYLDSNSTTLQHLAHHCKDCRASLEKFEDMAMVNSKIQFYLDPTLRKTKWSFNHDLVQTLLLYLRNPTLATLKEVDLLGSSQLNDVPVVNYSNGPRPEVSKYANYFFHEIFRHETYQELVCKRVSYSQDSGAIQKRYTVHCKCRGDEIAYFSRLLAHGFNVTFPFRDVVLNGLAS